MTSFLIEVFVVILVIILLFMIFIKTTKPPTVTQPISQTTIQQPTTSPIIQPTTSPIIKPTTSPTIQPTSSTTSSTTTKPCYEYKDYSGNDIPGLAISLIGSSSNDATNCQTYCNNITQNLSNTPGDEYDCQYFTYNLDNSMCYPKSGNNNAIDNQKTVSGPAVCPVGTGKYAGCVIS